MILTENNNLVVLRVGIPTFKIGVIVFKDCVFHSSVSFKLIVGGVCMWVIHACIRVVVYHSFI